MLALRLPQGKLIERSASVVDVVVVCLVNTKVVHSHIRRQQLGHLVPNVDSQVFGRRNHAPLHEERNVLV